MYRNWRIRSGNTKVLLFCTLAFLILLAGCSENEEEHSFSATIMEIHEDSILVEPDEDTAEYSSADRITVSLEDVEILGPENSEIGIGDMEEGDKVNIYYDGQLAESYPAQINGTYRIELLD